MSTIKICISGICVQADKLFLIFEAFVFSFQSDEHEMVDKPTQIEHEEKLQQLEKEIFELRKKKEEFTSEREQLQSRYARRTFWLMKIIDQLNSELEEHKNAQRISLNLVQRR